MALKDWQLQFLEREAALGKDYGKLQAAMGWGGMAGGLEPDAPVLTGKTMADFQSGPPGMEPGPPYTSESSSSGPDPSVLDWMEMEEARKNMSVQAAANLNQGGGPDIRIDPYQRFAGPPGLVPGPPYTSASSITRSGLQAPTFGDFGPGPNVPSNGLQLTPSGSTGPAGPVDPSADPNLWTSPMPGYIQFHPGGAVYEWTDDAATMQANQHLLTPVSGMDWHREFGIDQYIPDPTSFVPLSDDAIERFGRNLDEGRPSDMTRRSQWIRDHRTGEIYREPGALLGYTPGELKQIDKIINERAQNELARRQQEIANYLGIGGGGGGTFGGGTYGGYQGPAYSPYDPYNFPPYNGYPASGMPPAEVAGYTVPPPVPAGEPSFLPDPNPLDAHLELSNVGLERLPVDARLELDKWLKKMGYTTASLGQFGPGAYTRPTGWQDEIAFTADDYGRISDPIVRNWIKWLLGEMGYSSQAQYPGAVAP